MNLLSFLSKLLSLCAPADNSQSDDMAIIAVMVALSSLLVFIFIVIILYMLRWAVARQPEREAAFNRGASVCVYVDSAVSPTTGSRNTSRRGATPTPSGCPMGGRTIQVKDARVNHVCVHARLSHRPLCTRRRLLRVIS